MKLDPKRQKISRDKEYLSDTFQFFNEVINGEKNQEKATREKMG